MHHRLLTALLAAPALILAAPPSSAGVYITGSVATQATTMPYNAAKSEYGSASIDFDLGRYVRLGYTYGIEYQQTNGYKDPTADPAAPQSATYCTSNCGQTFNNTTEIDNSVGLTIILYEGQVFMPFLLAGGIIKTLTVESRDYDYVRQGFATTTTRQTVGPEPYGGGGLGIRLNREFTLKISYQVSQGVEQIPGQDPKRILDPRTTIGLTYQFL